MADKLKSRYNTLKSKTAVGKGNVTKALRNLEKVLASYEKYKGAETHLTTRRRVAAEVCESVEIARVKMKTLSELGDEFIDIITELDDKEFESPNKDTVISTIETEIEGFDKKFNDVMEEKEGAILDAESVVSGPPVLQTIQVQADPGPAGDTWSSFKPQGNLKPTYLEKNCNHLETVHFCNLFEIYIKDGYRGKIPENTVWMQLQPLINRVWFESLMHQNVKEKNLQEVIDLILEESSGRNPLHQRRIDLLRVKKEGSHSDFLFTLEEYMSLVEFNNMTKDSFLTHLFLEQADETMAKMATEILERKPKGDVNQLRQNIQQIESSTWYQGSKGPRNHAKSAKRYCGDCDSSTHNKEDCWGVCKWCNRRGHQADKCHQRPSDSKPEAKRAMEEEKTRLEKIAAEKSKKAAKRKEQKKRKAEKKAEATKKAAETGGTHIPTDSDSEISEEESPVKKGANEARGMRVGIQEEGRRSAKRVTFGLHEELEGMLENEQIALGRSIFSALKAKSAKESDSPILRGKVYQSRHSNKYLSEDLVADTGCTKPIISEDIVKDLNVQVKPLSKNMTIVDASGRSLDITGTVKLYVSSQALGGRRKLVEGAVLRGNSADREILISLQLLKSWNIIHPTFPHEDVYSFYSRTNKQHSAYSALYSNENEIYEKEGTNTTLKEPSKGCKDLREKLVKRFEKNFVTKLGPKDRMDVPPVKLVIDEERGVRPTAHIKPFDTPFHLRKPYEQEIRDALEGEVLVPCDKPTKWSSKAFAVPKGTPGKVRIVADFRNLNKALKRPVWPTESSGQLLRHIDPDSRVFCSIDATSGYHQIRVDKESQELLTIVTQMGRFSYTVTPQGVCSSSDLFNFLTDGTCRFDDTGTLKNMDDWLLFAPDLEGLEKKIVKLMKFCEDKNLKLNPSKMCIGEEVEFGGSVISAEIVKQEDVIFIAPKSKRIKAFEELRKPTCKKEVQVYCGMLASLQSWYPNLPLNIPLLRKATAGAGKFAWTPALEAEYQAVKEIMVTQIRLSPYDPEKKLRLIIDGASSLGVGYVLFQYLNDEEPAKGALIISANSSMLSEQQTGYSPIDSETIALDFACQACHYWIYYCPEIILYSDCSGLLDMIEKPLADITNKRHQKILTRIQNYNLKGVHIPGLENKICDCLSRLCRAVTKTHHYPIPAPRLLPMSKRASVHAKQLEIQDPLVADLAVAGAANPQYVAMLNDIENGTAAKDLPEDSELRNISGLLGELGTVVMSDGTRLIVRNGTEILIPVEERQRILETLHLTHSCDEVMIRQTKGKIFWPRMREAIKKFYLGCNSCTENRISRPQKANEIDFTDVFENFYPNQMVEVDFCQKGNKDYLIFACSLTGFIQAYETKNKSSAEAVLKLRQWGANWGLPYWVKSDFGPGFRQTFENDLSKLGVKVDHSSGYNPQSNGMVERAVRSLKELLKKSGPLSQLQIHELVYCINAREQAAGAGSPLARFLGHGVRSGLPNSLDRSYNWKKSLEIRAELHQKRVARPGRVSKEIYEVGETVLVQDVKSKLWKKRGVITAVRTAHDGTIVSYELSIEGNNTTRHRRFLRKVPTGELPESVSPPIEVESAIPEPVGRVVGGRTLRPSRQQTA